MIIKNKKLETNFIPPKFFRAADRNNINCKKHRLYVKNNYFIGKPKEQQHHCWAQIHFMKSNFLFNKRKEPDGTD